MVTRTSAGNSERSAPTPADQDIIRNSLFYKRGEAIPNAVRMKIVGALFPRVLCARSGESSPRDLTRIKRHLTRPKGERGWVYKLRASAKKPDSQAAVDTGRLTL